MILQTVVLPDKMCDESKLYIRKSGQVILTEKEMELINNASVSTQTYINLFDFGTWKKYTEVSKVRLRVKAYGKGEIRVFRQRDYEFKECFCVIVDKMDYEYIEKELHEEGTYYITFATQSNLRVQSAYFYTEEQETTDVQLKVLICTYKRKKQIEEKIECFQKSKFWDVEDERNGKLSVNIIDNASELVDIHDRYIQIYHNPNTGGAGGFGRGICEARKDKSSISNIVFMDDDAEIIMESFYRLYALLSYMRAEYSDYPIAGRMFRLDDKRIQYTAAEIWNAGNIQHIGWNSDMTDLDCLQDMNQNQGAQYGGWWFCCYPMGFVMKNDPIPVFLHCDDVEYGLRIGKEPIILNGIQVWHETYEYRKSAVINYYDYRNTLIVNKMYSCEINDKKDLVKSWKEIITKHHVNKDYLNEYMIIKALYDYEKWRRTGKFPSSYRLHKKISKKNANRIENAFFWRLTEKYTKRGERLWK